MLINKFSTSLIRDIIESLGLPTSVDNDGRIFLCWGADEKFSHDIHIYFYIEDEKILRVFGYVPDFLFANSMHARAMIAVNEYNNKNNLITAVATESNIVVARNELLSNVVSDSFIRDSCIGCVLSEFVEAFTYFDKLF